MKLPRTIWIWFAVGKMLLSQPQTGWIQGTVIDETVKQPLVGANIVIPGLLRGASTDEKGKFVIEKLEPGTYQLEVSYVGYITVIKTDIIVRAGKPTIVNFEMKSQPLQGDVVEVVAGYFVQELSVDPGRTSLNREEIRRFPGGFEDVVRTIATLPGVAINNGGGRNDLLVRGGGPAENLFVVNNIEVPNINHFGTQGTSSGSLSFINLDLIENVDFSAGGFGPEYGDKMSSVVSLKLSEGRNDRLSSKFLISATQFGLNLEGPLSKKGSFIFSARRSYLDFIFKAAGLPFTPVYTDVNLIGKFEISPSVQLSFLSLLALDGIDRLTKSEKDLVINAGVMGNNQRQLINGANLRYLMKNAYLDITFQANLYAFRFNQKDENLSQYFSSHSDEWEYGVKFSYTRKLPSLGSFTVGGGVKIPSIESTTIFADSIYDKNGRKIAYSELGLPKELLASKTVRKDFGFVKWEIPIFSRLITSLGFRTDRYDFIDQKTVFAPRFSAKYQLNDRQSLRFSYGHYYQAPSYVWTLTPSNRSLKALKNEMIIAGWDFLPRKDVLLKAEFYHKTYSSLPTGTIPGVNDYLVQTNTGLAFGGRDDNFVSFGFYPMTSVGTGVAYGGEIQLQKKFSEIPLYGQISISVGKSEVTAANGKTYPAQFDQRFIFNISAGYQLGKKWELGGKFRYFTGAPYTPVYIPEKNPVNPGFIQNLPEEYLSKRLPAGHHLDLRVDRYFYSGNKRFILYLDVQNVYNYKIPILPSYNFWEKKIVRSNAIGLLPSIGFSAEF